MATSLKAPSFSSVKSRKKDKELTFQEFQLDRYEQAKNQPVLTEH